MQWYDSRLSRHHFGGNDHDSVVDTLWVTTSVDQLDHKVGGLVRRRGSQFLGYGSRFYRFSFRRKPLIGQIVDASPIQTTDSVDFKI